MNHLTKKLKAQYEFYSSILFNFTEATQKLVEKILFETYAIFFT